MLAWNSVLLQACANDYDPAVVSPPDQAGPSENGPCLRDRARGDLRCRELDRQVSSPYLTMVYTAAPAPSIDAAVARALVMARWSLSILNKRPCSTRPWR